MRTCTIAISAWIAALALGGGLPSSVAETVDPTSNGKLTVVLLPAQVSVFKMGLLSSKPSEEWTTAARASLDAAVREAVTQSTHLDGTELPNVTPEEHAAIDEFLAVAKLVVAQVSGRTKQGVAKVPRATIDRTLGPALAFLHDRTGADYAIGTIGAQVGQSKEVVAVGTALTVATAVFAPFAQAVPALTSSYAGLLIVDLRTGELRWFNRRSGYEFAGVDFSDLRDPESVRKVIQMLLEPYPEIPSLRGEKGSPSAPTGGVSTDSTSPSQGEFAIKAPVGWRAWGDTSTVTATRDGGLLNQIHVELRDHSHAFPRTEQQSTRESTPDQLADWYAAELRLQNLADLQIAETSVNAQLAGRAAFRIRFSYRLPIEADGARIEQVTIGTAVPHGLLLAQLSAPQLNYFAKSLPAFEESARTISLKPRRHLP